MSKVTVKHSSCDGLVDKANINVNDWAVNEKSTDRTLIRRINSDLFMYAVGGAIYYEAIRGDACWRIVDVEITTK